MSVILEKKLNAFAWLNIYDSRLSFHYIGSLGFSLKGTNIGSDKDLVPKNCQATIKDQMKTQPTDA